MASTSAELAPTATVARPVVCMVRVKLVPVLAVSESDTFSFRQVQRFNDALSRCQRLGCLFSDVGDFAGRREVAVTLRVEVKGLIRW